MALCMIVGLTACNGGWSSSVKDFSGEVSSNGGFAVVKGDYVYFINGQDESTADNAFGKVVKGALVRAKVADLSKAADYSQETEVECETVVPKLIYTDYDDENSGFYIFGDYVYYVTPSDELNKKGEPQNTVAEFTKIRLDGKDEKIIAKVDGLSTPYRFVEGEDKNVYLTVYTTDADGKNVLVTYNDAGKEVSRSQALTNYFFSTDATQKYAFYEKKAYDPVNEEDLSFSELHRYSLDGTNKDEVVLSGAGSFVAAENGVGGAQGVTFAFTAFVGETLYFSETTVDTSTTTVTRYFAAKATDFEAAEVEDYTPDYAVTRKNYDKVTKEVLASGESTVSTVFATTSVFVAPDCILYNDADYGVMKYNYKNATPGENKQEKVYYDKDLKGYTYKYNDGTYMYYLSEDTYLYRLKISDLVNADGSVKANASEAKAEKLNHVSAGAFLDWFRPEFVGDYMLMLNLNDPYYEYVYVVNLEAEGTVTLEDGTTAQKKVKEMTADELKEYETELNTLDREHILNKASALLGVMSEADAEAFEEYMDETYPEKEEE